MFLNRTHIVGAPIFADFCRRLCACILVNNICGWGWRPAAKRVGDISCRSFCIWDKPSFLDVISDVVILSKQRDFQYYHSGDCGLYGEVQYSVGVVCYDAATKPHERGARIRPYMLADSQDDRHGTDLYYRYNRCPISKEPISRFAEHTGRLVRASLTYLPTNTHHGVSQCG